MRWAPRPPPGRTASCSACWRCAPTTWSAGTHGGAASSPPARPARTPRPRPRPGTGAPGGRGAAAAGWRGALGDSLRGRRLGGRDGTLAWRDDAPKSVGGLRAFYGNFGILVRAHAYLARLGGPGLAEATRLAVLNANYLRARLRGTYHLPYDTPSLHERVFSDRNLQDYDMHTLDVAKRLLDYGFYAPTIYFPLVVKGALMVEPT